MPGGIPSARVIEMLSRLVSKLGAPRDLSSDNALEFVSKALLKRISESNIDSDQGDPSKSWQNGTDESFNGRLRVESLNVVWYRSRREACEVIETWRL